MFAVQSKIYRVVLPLLTLALTLFFVGVVGSHAEAAKRLPDLIVSAVSAPSTAQSGQNFVFSASIKNQGRASANNVQAAFYLTKSSSSTTGATLLGTQNVGSLPAGAILALTTTLSIPSSTSPGTFYVAAVADPSNITKESKETNNTRASGAITIESIAPASTAPALEYYVSPTGNDAADGSAAHPWATIQHAADSVGPGTIVHVAPGDYPQAIVSRASGTATARIQFVSDTPWGAKIRSTGTQYTWENHGNYLNIQDFDITGDGRIGILNWASNVQIIGNHVHDIPATGCPSDGGAGIDHADYSAQDNDTIANVVHDVGAPGCYAVQGIYHSNLRGHIMNNISFRNAGWGIHLYHAPMNVVVANNLSFANGKGGIVVGAPAGGTYIADGMRVVNNIVIDNGSYGIKEAEQTGSDNQYLNNLVYGNVDDDWYIQGSFATPPTNIVANPQLVNYQPDGTGNYHLALGSPAIDSGTSVWAPSDDFDGDPRPQGAGWDIGPYEWRP